MEDKKYKKKEKINDEDNIDKKENIDNLKDIISNGSYSTNKDS